MFTDSQFPVLLNVTKRESESHCDITADITGFRAQHVRVVPYENSLIVEMQVRHEPGQSYYLGEIEPKTYQRVIPLGFDIKTNKVLTHYNNGKLHINVVKRERGSSLEHRASLAYA